VQPILLKNKQLTGGLTMFFFQYLAQAGLFFVVPLYLSVALGLSALATGARLTPLSLTLLAGAIGIPRLRPQANPRRVVRLGLLMLLLGTVILLGALDTDAGAEIVLLPMLMIGFGIGALASQLGSVTVSAVADDQAPEVGGIQNTATNLGASLGTALAGALLIAALSTSFLTNIENNDAIPTRVKSEAQVKLAGGVPFISDADLEKALDDANVPSRTRDEAVKAYQAARITGLKAALAILALMDVLAQFLSGRIPKVQPGSAEAATSGEPSPAATG
jgi:Na+/melibiose symporter-like transporter